MEHSKLPSLADRLPADFEECERLSRRVYALVEELEPLILRQHALEREFSEGDLYVRSGPRKGQPLTRVGRQRRLQELLSTHRQAVELHRSVEWLERRRELLLLRLAVASDS